MTETFAVFVQADIPAVSAETTFVPLGMTEELAPISAPSMACGVDSYP
jgi:hypothetical protein